MGSKTVGNSKGSRSGGVKGGSKGQNNITVQRGSFISKTIDESRMSEQSARLEGEGITRPQILLGLWRTTLHQKLSATEGNRSDIPNS